MLWLRADDAPAAINTQYARKSPSGPSSASGPMRASRSGTPPGLPMSLRTYGSVASHFIFASLEWVLAWRKDTIL